MLNNYNNIPKKLKDLANWVAWIRVKKYGEIKKIPINPTNGKRADVTDSQTWGTFEDALSACQQFNLDGIGFVFTPENPYVGIDIDHCIDENRNMNAVAREIILKLNSYTEYSPSGSGVHVLCKGQLPDGKKRDSKIGLEMYSKDRYFTITGNIVPGSTLEVEDRGETLRSVHQKYLGHKENDELKKVEQEQEGGAQKKEEHENKDYDMLVGRSSLKLTDEEIIEKAKRANRGQIFEQLYLGNWEGYYKSQSEAELSFANMLAFWTAKDRAVMDRIYKMSGLKRAKWDERREGTTYGQLVLMQAINNCTNVYDRTRGKRESKGSSEKYGIQGIGEPRKEENTGTKEEKFNQEEHSQASIETRNPNLNQPSPWYQISSNGTNIKFFPAVLAKYLSEKISAVVVDGQTYLFQNGVYLVVKDIKLERIVKAHLRNDHANMHAIRDVVFQWKIDAYEDNIRFDEASFAHIINLKNGLYDIYQLKLLPHSPDYHSLIQLDCSYDPDAKCEKFLDFINEVLPPESVILAQEIAGYILVPMTNAQKAFILYGPGATGKSTFIHVLEALVGEKNVSNIAWQDLSDKFRPARLQGKLLNTFSDIPDKALNDNGNFKIFAGEDRNTVENKNQDPFEFRNTARFVFSANHLPQNFGDNGDGFSRKLLILPFENKIAREKMDTRLTEELVTERNGIFLWALEGLMRLLRNDFKFSENKYTQKVLAKYQQESNSVRWFIENNCVFAPNYNVRTVEFFERYQQSCKQDGIQPLNRIKFNNEMEENYKNEIVKKQEGTSRRAFWWGIKII